MFEDEITHSSFLLREAQILILKQSYALMAFKFSKNLKVLGKGAQNAALSTKAGALS